MIGKYGNFYTGLKYFLFFFLFFLLIVPASAASGVDNELVAKGVESVLDENLSADQMNPTVYENRIVWQERRESLKHITSRPSIISIPILSRIHSLAWSRKLPGMT